METRNCDRRGDKGGGTIIDLVTLVPHLGLVLYILYPFLDLDFSVGLAESPRRPKVLEIDLCG
jgi:hypothetical protein